MTTKYNEEKHKQLGMNVGTASNRLVKDLLFDLAVKAGHMCLQCGAELTRDTFSIEHKVPWLHSQNPMELFFDLNNIAFSHLSCNMEARRIPTKEHGYKCKCRICLDMKAEKARNKYTKERRQAQYKRTGK